MSMSLKVALGQYSHKGCKATNQDFFGSLIPKEPQLSLKGSALALADGISSSDVSHIASETAVKSFLNDYFSTSETWTVKKSAQCVLAASNAWLCSQSRQGQHRYDRNKGYVCTFSAIVLKSTTAHLLHIGDSRIYRLKNKALEQLTTDHRLWISQEKSYLSRGLGIDDQLEIDYRAIPLAQGDVFILATDGVYEFVAPELIIATLERYPEDLDSAAQQIVNAALANGSDDNLTIQIACITQLPKQAAHEILQQIDELPFPPTLDARMSFDGFRIIREVHATSRSHVYLAVDELSEEKVILKTPSIDLRGDAQYLERFLLEEWIAKRINSPHVLKPCKLSRKRNYLYTVTEYIEGQTLAQWLIDHPKPSLESVRGIIEQVGKGLRAFHRLEMIHQDLKPDNIMIDKTGTVKIIDFGSTRVSGLLELAANNTQNNLLGTALYTAPEYFLGDSGTHRSDQFSLAVLTYYMLSGTFPYGTQVAKARTPAAHRALSYQSVLDDEREIPLWIDYALKKALSIAPHKRYEDISEFLYDLRHPNDTFVHQTRPPLIERNPVVFWQSLSIILSIAVIALLIK